MTVISEYFAHPTSRLSKYGMIALAAVPLALVAACSSTNSSGPTGVTPTKPGSTATTQAAGNPLGLITPGTIAVGALPSQVPMSMVDKDGKPTGFGPELMRYVADKLGLSIKFTVTTGADELLGVRTGKYDAFSSVAVMTPDRAKLMQFSIPFYESDAIVVTQKADHYPTMASLAGKLVGVANQSAQQPMLAKFPDIKAKIFAQQSDEVTALRAGQVDAVFLGGVDGRTVVEKNPTELALGASVPSPEASGFGIAPDRPELKKAIDDAITSAMKDGTFMKLWNQFVSFPPDQSILNRYPELKTDAK